MMSRSFRDVHSAAAATKQRPFHTSLLAGFALASLLSGLTAMPCAGQTLPLLEARVESPAELPDAPKPAAPSLEGISSSSNNLADPQAAAAGQQPIVPRSNDIHQRAIHAGEIAPLLSPGDKVLLGLSSAASRKAAAGWLGADLYEMAIDGSPKYGQTAKGFAQRLGAAAARDSSETIFYTSVFAPIFHEDPRYYQMGPGNSFVKRVGYAVTRVVITRNDAGNSTVNYSLLAGNLAGAALTQAYYPPQNTGFSEVMKTFAGSIGGGALGFVVDEFFIDTFRFMQRK